MQIIRLIVLIAIGSLLAGCDSHEGADSRDSARPTSKGQFSFITTNTTLQEVVKRVGQFDRIRGSGISYYEYDLSGGSAVLINLEWPFQLTNKIHGIKFYQSTNDIGLSP